MYYYISVRIEMQSTLSEYRRARASEVLASIERDYPEKKAHAAPQKLPVINSQGIRQSSVSFNLEI